MPARYHAGRNFAKGSASQIFLACVVYPAGTPVQQLVTVPIDDTVSWNLQISTLDDLGNEKPNVAAACSNQACSLSTPPDSDGKVYIQTNSSDSSKGWNISKLNSHLDYFDNSTTGCTPPSPGEFLDIKTAGRGLSAAGCLANFFLSAGTPFAKDYIN